MRNRAMLLAGAALACGLASPAHADAIDGNWCHPQRGQLEIRGPQVVTPGGASLTGNYSRHAYEYVAPAGEAFGGKTVNMALVDDETVHLLIVDGPSSIEVWHRCTAPVS